MPLERREIDQSLRAKGFRLEQSRRDHDFYFFEYGGMSRAIFTRMSRGSSHRTISERLIGKMARQLKMTRAQFDDLIECPFSREDMVVNLQSQGIIEN